MSNYIGLAALKEALGMTGTSDDTVDDGVLASVIVRSSALVDGYLTSIRPGYVGFAASSNATTAVGSNTRVYDGTGTDTLFIDDAQTISSISVDTVAVSSNSWRLAPYNANPKRMVIFAAPASSIHGLTVEHFLPGTANVAVTGYFGLDTVPDDVVQVVLSLSILLWRRYQSGDPAPGPTSAMGGRGQITNDPELLGILEGLWPRWGVLGVWGA